MRSRHLIATLLVVLLTSMLGLAPPAHAEPIKVLFEKRATLTKSITGLPAAGSEPGERIHSANVRLQYDRANRRANLFATVTMAGEAPSHPGVKVTVGVGTFKGATCQVSTIHDSVRYFYPEDDRNRRLAELDFPMSARPNCAVAVSEDWATGTVLDAKVGPMRDITVSPALKMPKVMMLGSKQRTLKLIRGVPQLHMVKLRNAGSYRASGVTVKAKGKGVRVKPVKVGVLEAGETAYVYVSITLTGKQKRSRLRLRVSGSGSVDRLSLPVRRVAAPRPAKSGRWEGQQFSFRVARGRITGFRGTGLRMECRIPGSYPTVKNVSLTFPKVKIPKHGYIQASAGKRGNGWSWAAKLRGRIVGNKLTQGSFTYGTANCWVNEGVTAAPVGR